MTTIANSDSNVLPEPPPFGAIPELRWQIRLYEDAPARRWAILGTALIAAAAGWLLFQMVVFPIVAILAIFGSTTEFWLPIRYVLDDKGASARCGFGVSAIEWSEVKRALVYETQVKLTPIATETRLGEFRGVVFRYGSQKEAILENIEQRLGTSCLIFGSKN